jgi:RNA polymerase sigma factor (sigma-70 family)
MKITSEKPGMRAFAETLTTHERLLVQLYYCEELTLAEIAAVLGVDVGHVGAMHRGIIERVQQITRGPRVAK